MIATLRLTHPCGTAVYLQGGAYLDFGGRVVTHCPRCGEWLGSPFVRAEPAISQTPFAFGAHRGSDG